MIFERGVIARAQCKYRDIVSVARQVRRDTSMIKWLKELEAENARLKKMYAEERLKAEIRKDALEGKL